MKFLRGFTKKEVSWMMYDWANSAHSVVVVTILPIFFNTVASYMQDAASGMTVWGYATSAAMAIVALAAPVLGVFGDFEGFRKKLFTVFMLVGVLSCAGLAITPQLDFVTPGTAEKVGLVILVLYILSTIGFAGANLYYDSFLNDVTTEERMDKVSTMGYGLGYIGGSTIPLLIFLLMNLILGSDAMLFCLSFAFGLTAVWWFVFSFPLLKNVEQVSFVPRKKGAVKDALKGIGGTVKEIFRYKQMFVFLIAYFFYIDGVNTIIHMSTSYGDTLGLDSTSMLLALLLVQVLGLPFALLYIKASEKFGARFMVGVGICIYMCVTVFGFFLREVWQFWVMAIMVATSQGGIQALSRSMFGKLIPDKNRSGEFFGFYDIFGKFSAIMGPALVGLSSALAADVMLAEQGLDRVTATAEQLAAVDTAAAPWGILSVLLIFFVGGGLYFFVLPKYLKKNK
ncbi:MFS transporter [Candidatus Allofournierella merdipullorum]|uniref:MFS transporter n=1 Tax=Candidatus Allofournierella merdipullorum TaxID=2838595 RepID=UPI002A8FC12B|nr:MFS transporter [Candidatus Fournierella merdipullorum]